MFTRTVYTVEGKKIIISQVLLPLTLIQPGEVKVDLASLTSTSGQNSYMLDFFKITLFLQKCLANLYELLT
jgi:hypothetical protein